MSHEPSSALVFDIAFYEQVYAHVDDYPEVIELLGGLYTRAGRIVDGWRMDWQMVRLQPDNPTARYNLACSLALMGKGSDALRVLRQAIARGYQDVRWLKKDPDLKSLHANPAFQKLVHELTYR